MCCECCCSANRCCCDPIIPYEKSDSAKCWRYTIIAIVVLQFLVTIVKIAILGFFAAISDIAAFTILLIAAFRVDYCLAIVFVTLQLMEIFSITVVLGYFLQTDMGRNVPGKEDPDDSPDKENKNHQSLVQSTSVH